MQEKIMALFQKSSKEYLTFSMIKKSLKIKKNSSKEKNKELYTELQECLNALVASKRLYVDSDNHYSLAEISPKKRDTKELILSFFQENKAITLTTLITSLAGTLNKEEIIACLKELELDGYIYYHDYNNCFYKMPSNFFVTKITSDRNGNMLYSMNGKFYRLPPNSTSGVLNNDIVIIKRKYKTEKESLIKIIKRGNPQIVCEIKDGNKIEMVGNPHILLKFSTKKEFNNYPVGTRFVAYVPTISSPNDYYTIKPLYVLNKREDYSQELETIALNNGFQTSNTKEELEQIASIPQKVTPAEIKDRLDLRSENIFTIDGSNTKDMDDAVSINSLPNGNYELTVSIAHVSHYIKFASPLWLRAEQNTTSLYMVDSVLHMLHPSISNGICSLNPGVDRLAKSYIMEIDHNGNLVNFKIADTVINSKKKMTYEEVNQILEQNQIPEGYEPFLNDLLKMQELSEIITHKRMQNGAIDFANKEINFCFDSEHNIESITTHQSGTAERIVENFMIMTNEAVANQMLNSGLLFIYRNHEIPFKNKIMEAMDIIKRVKSNVSDNEEPIKRHTENQLNKFKNLDDPHVIQKIINSLKSKEEFFILSSLIIKSMQKAYYSINNQSHYGLALNAYSQVTSPIRRFLDLLIEYILDNLEMFYMPNFDFEAWKQYLVRMCSHASFMEKCATKAEKEANDLYLVNYVATNPDKEYTAYVSTVTPNYLVVKTEEEIEGIVYFDDIEDGKFIYSPESKAIYDMENKKQIFIGTKLTISLKAADKQNRLIYFYAKSLTRLKPETLTRKKEE